MHFELINGVSHHYRLDGEVEDGPILFLNSLGTDYRIWDGMVRALQAERPILRYDMRGHGLTGMPEAPHTISGLAEDALALMDAAGIAKVDLVGLSIGGMVAQQIAGTAPDRVRKVVLMDTGHKIGTEDLWNTRIAAVRSQGVAAIADSILERWFAPSFRERHPALFSGTKAMLTRTSSEGYSGLCEALRDADLTGNAGRIMAETLCIVGDHDKSTPTDLVLSLADLIPNSSYRVVENAGHLPCLEHPELVAKIVAEHFGHWAP